MLSKTLPIDDVIIRYLNGTQKDDRINDIIDAIDSKLNIISKMTSAKGIYAIDKFTNVIRSLADNVSLITYERLISSLDSISSLDINAHVIQGGVLIKHSGVFSFLDKWYPNVANEFVRSYSNILGYYYLYHFVRYGMLLEQRKVSPDKVTRSLNSESSLNIRLSSYFEVAQDDSVIVLGINQDNKSYFPEELVRSVLIAFKDNAYMEYQFECGFFKHSKLLCDILSKTVSYMKDFIINIIVGTKVVDLVSLILALTSVKYCIGTAVCRAAHQIRDFYNEINVEIQSLYDKYVTLLKTPIMTSITKASNYGLVDDYALKKISLDFVKLLTFILSSGRNIFAGSDDAGLGDIVSRYYSFIHNLPHSPKAQPSREAARKLNALMLVSNMLSEYKLASFDDSKVRVEAEIKKVVADFVELELSESFDLNRKPDIESYKSRLSSLHKYFLSKVTDKSVCDSILDVLIDSLANKLRSLHGDGNDLSNVLFSWREIARSRDSSRK